MVKNPRDTGSISGLGRSPGEGNGNPLQYSCLKSTTDKGAWWATVHEVAKSRTRLRDTTEQQRTRMCRTRAERAGRTQQAEEPVGSQSTGSRRAGHA